MASRRTRIKGIANIPQRRKTNANVESLQSQVQDDKKTENCSLTFLPDVEKAEDKENNSTAVKNANTSDVSKSNDIPQNSSGVELENDRNLIQQKDESQVGSVPEIQEPKLPPVRRKFIKPTISANVIIRKAKQGIEKENSDKSGEVGNSPKQPLSHTDEFGKPPSAVSAIVRKQEDNKAQLEFNQIKQITAATVITGVEITLNETNLVPQNDLVAKGQTTSDKGPKKLATYVNSHCSDNEYPPPPPSPSKINRSRIKAIPRLGYRKTSFSASESEDESRRNYNRNRNDSVCSTTSGIPESITECASPQRPREFTSYVQKKCARTEQSRKLAEARREFQRRFGTTQPDRQRLTMIDLIFYNPTTNPMKTETKAKPENIGKTDSEQTANSIAESEKVDDPEVEKEQGEESDEENEMPVPQIKIGPSGEIILDEKSLVIESKEVKKQREELQKTQLVDGDFDTGYGIYKRQKRAKDWTQSETLRFYKALNTIGTDFTLMCELFPKRTRRELKMKFKKEERINKNLVDKAVMQPCSFDFTELKHEMDMEEREMEELQRQREDDVRLKQERLEEKLLRKRKAQKKEDEIVSNEIPKPVVPKPPKIRKTKKHKLKKFNIESVLEESDADESDIATQSESEDEISIPLKPTRSGRMPKITRKFDNSETMSIDNIIKRNKVPENTKTDNIEPGSLMIITEKGQNNEPIYKIFMVTSEKSAEPLNLTPDAVKKAIEFKKGIIAQNILTISANITNNEYQNNDDLEENNYTIPADENVISMQCDNPTQNNACAVVENVTIPTDENVTTLRIENK